MKIGVLGDLHITNKAPTRRKDDYFQTLLRKLRQALEIFEDNDCHFVVQVGDFFDTPTVANRVKIDVMRLLHDFSHHIYCCAGQHDISGHSLKTLSNSPLMVLNEAFCGVSIVGREELDNVHIYGASFGEEVPKVCDLDKFNVLVTHRMIGNRPLFPGQELESPRNFLRANPNFNLVLVGDYHYAFQDTYQGRLILNTGCIVRKNLNDVREGLSPKVSIVSVPDLTVQEFPLNCESVETVFDLTKVEDNTKNKQALDRFLDRLKNSESSKVGWKSILQEVLREKMPGKSVEGLVDEILLEVDK